MMMIVEKRHVEYGYEYFNKTVMYFVLEEIFETYDNEENVGKTYD